MKNNNTEKRGIIEKEQRKKCLMKSNNTCTEKRGIIEKERRKRGRRNKVNIST